MQDGDHAIQEIILPFACVREIYTVSWAELRINRKNREKITKKNMKPSGGDGVGLSSGERPSGEHER